MDSKPITRERIKGGVLLYDRYNQRSTKITTNKKVTKLNRPFPSLGIAATQAMIHTVTLLIHSPRLKNLPQSM